MFTFTKLKSVNGVQVEDLVLQGNRSSINEMQGRVAARRRAGGGRLALGGPSSMPPPPVANAAAGAGRLAVRAAAGGSRGPEGSRPLRRSSWSRTSGCGGEGGRRLGDDESGGRRPRVRCLGRNCSGSAVRKGNQIL